MDYTDYAIPESFHRDGRMGAREPLGVSSEIDEVLQLVMAVAGAHHLQGRFAARKLGAAEPLGVSTQERRGSWLEMAVACAHLQGQQQVLRQDQRELSESVSSV
jgi:hypothetical protein